MNEHCFSELADKAGGRKLVLYGMGMTAVEANWILSSNNNEVDFFVDRKADTVPFYLGKKVMPPVILDSAKHYVIIVPAQYTRQISDILISKGFKTDADFCAWDRLRNTEIILDGIKIGKHTHGFSAFSDCLGVSSKNYIESIGSFVSINKTAFIGADHRMLLSTSHEVLRIINADDCLSEGSPKSRLKIGNDVWIGANTFINASKVHTIGDGAIIGTGAIVINDVPPFSVVVGVPARVKKYRFSTKQIKILQKEKWWEWNDEKIKANSEYFLDPGLFFKKFKGE